MRKTIFFEFFNQKKWIDRPRPCIDSALSWINENPAAFLWLIWSAYLLLDISGTFLLGYKIESYTNLLINFLGCGFIIQYWFFFCLPRLTSAIKWKRQAVIFFLLVATFLIAKLMLALSGEHPEINYRSFFVFEFLRLSQFLIFVTALWFLYSYTASEKEKANLDKNLQLLKIEHKMLQLSPHFMLNMITQYSASIMSLSKNLYSDITKFSYLLKYSYKGIDEENTLMHEIEAVKYYLDCQKQRFGSSLHMNLKMEIPENLASGLQMPKWTLLTLIENIFKHGNCFSSSFPCFISFSLISNEDGTLIFNSLMKNSFKNQAHLPVSGFGLKAIKSILHHHFNEKFQLQIQKDNNVFYTHLTITYDGTIKGRFA